MLNLPDISLKTRKTNRDSLEVFDIVRKKYVSLTPEENVRQHFIHYLIFNKGYPASLIAVERGLMVNKLKKRFDAVAYNNNGEPLVLIEFKSPDVKISQAVFEQISAYNIKLKVKYLIVSNGLIHYCCMIDYIKSEIVFLEGIPNYKEISVA